jgi:hypothetical protein
MRAALKERQKARDVAAYRDPRKLHGPYRSAFDGFFRSFRANRVFTTQYPGFRQASTLGEFLYAFSVLGIPVFLSFPTSVRYLMNFSPITLVRLRRVGFFCGYVARDEQGQYSP